MKAPATLATALVLLCALPGAARAEDSLYAQLGGKPALEAVVDGLLQRAARDSRIQDFFKETNLQYLRTQLVDQLCAASGGPCHYEGGSMKDVHAAMGLKQAHFNALVEDLQDALDAAGVPFATQGRLLALLAPMHRDIVTR